MSHQPASPGPQALRPFDHKPRTRLVFGVDRIEQLGELAREIGAKKVLLVTDPGIVAAGHADHVRRNLEQAGLQITLFDQALENPSTKCVDNCLAVAKKAGPDTIIGLGGGSAMDTAKGCNFLLTNGWRIPDYRGLGEASKPMLPLIARPTRAGTGREVPPGASVVDDRSHSKMSRL